MGPFAQLSLGLRLARRDLRGGIRSLRIVLACLALGVAAIAAVGTLRAGLAAGFAADGARILGGDVELRSGARPAGPEARDWIAARGGTVSEIVALRAMLVAPSAERLLVELKAVDGAYPLYGTLGLEPAVALGPEDVALDPLVAERLGLSPGDMVRIGEASLRFAATVAQEPDKVATPAIFGPRALITRAALDRAALLQPGSLVQYDTRIRLPPGTSPHGFAAALREAFPAEGWRVRTADAAEPGMNRFLDRAAAFLTLAGLTALLVGGIGVATGVRAWLEARARSIATLRCLGASASTIFVTYLIQVLVLSVLGICIGLVAGYGLTWAAAQALAGTLPVPPRLAPYPAPLALAALYGLLTALSFALWPLGRAARISGAALFRDAVQPASGPSGACGTGAQPRRSGGAGRAHRGDLGRPLVRRLVLRRGGRGAGAVPRRRSGADGAGAAARPSPPAGLAAGAGQLAPPGGADAGAGGGARHRADDAGRHRPDRGQPSPSTGWGNAGAGHRISTSSTSSRTRRRVSTPWPAACRASPRCGACRASGPGSSR